ARRRVGFVQDPIEESWALTGSLAALQGASFAEIYERFVDAEYRVDLAEARARLGRDEVGPDELDRTPAQRRADALVAMAHRAATAPPEGRRPEPLVNIVIDQASFESELARLAGADTPAPDTIDPTGRVCRTLSGHHLHPGDAVAAAVIGHVRRVVVNAEGTVIDLGRKQRCFTGAARDAVLLNQSTSGGIPRCMWPGCDRAVRHLQIDHVERWSAGGPTDTDNGWPGCGFHNRLKEAGFIPHREPDGTWTYHRPNNGGPITPSV
ncbi:MAG TPA: HNH endonuclease signature motif containing protein, partial [Ilumatobacteraceae bacterium]|nr:HNH endonuclease signature motif containing protein [Ilumatobacteraceae bacterium]